VGAVLRVKGDHHESTVSDCRCVCPIIEDSKKCQMKAVELGNLTNDSAVLARNKIREVVISCERPRLRSPPSLVHDFHNKNVRLSTDSDRWECLLPWPSHSLQRLWNIFPTQIKFWPGAPTGRKPFSTASVVSPGYQERLAVSCSKARWLRWI
jgi:hypothetical protein